MGHAGVFRSLNRIGLDVVVMGIVSTENRCRSAIAYGLHERDGTGVFLGLQGIGVAIGGWGVDGIGGFDAGPIAGGVIRTHRLEVLGALLVIRSNRTNVPKPS